MSDTTPETPIVTAKPSSAWWGIVALLTAWTGLIGFVLSIVALIKGVKKATANSINTALGIVSGLLAIGAMVVQLIFSAALIFGNDSNNLGTLKDVSSTSGKVRYSMQLPEKFTRETIDKESDRYIYRKESTDIVRSIAVISCTEEGLEDITTKDAIEALRIFLVDLPDDKTNLRDLADSFGGVKNLNVGYPEPITEGRYASKGYAIRIYADHPTNNESMTGEMHVMTSGSGLCSGAWLATKDIQEKNESSMDLALSSIQID